jgi:hypothetical protein
METIEDVPVINVEAFLTNDESKVAEECKKVAESLHKYGILIWRDPRVNHQDNEEYLDMMEKYFEEEGIKYYEGKKLEDCKPEVNFQAGVTPEKIEKARNHYKIAETLKEEDKPRSTFPP